MEGQEEFYSKSDYLFLYSGVNFFLTAFAAANFKLNLYARFYT